MSTKVAKTATKPTAAKTAGKAETKPKAVRLSDEDKKADPANYIYNPNTKHYVSRTSPTGKKLVKAEQLSEETGEEVVVPKTMTETQRLILILQTVADQCDISDSAIKAALTSIESVKAELPRGFPSAWGGKQKTARHPDHPKQPSNPFIFYCKAVRPSVVEANTGADGKCTLINTEIISTLSKMWKATAEEDRTEYNEQAAADKVRYEAEMKVFEAEHPEEARAKSSPGDGKPTKETAYHLYCEEHREEVAAENPDLDGKQVTKKLAEMWEVVKKEDKAKVEEYQAAADKANEGFEERVEEYHTSPGSSPKLSKAEQAKADDPEHYELNKKTNRYVLKDEWKKNPDGSFVLKVKKEASPKKPAAKPAAKKPATKPAAKPAEKKVTKPAEKKATASPKKVEEDKEDKAADVSDDDLLVEP
jgi:hypothetical protein